MDAGQIDLRVSFGLFFFAASCPRASAAPFPAGNFLGPRVPFRVRVPVHISVALEGQKQGLQTTVAAEVLGGDV